MTQLIPEMPTNVQATNPYTGIDRGLFLVHFHGEYSVGRIHAARVVTHGPAAAVGVLEYKVMAYVEQPTTPEEYAAGVILKAPDGTEWFDCFSRGSVLTPIVVEYWAINSFLKYYSVPGAAKLDQVSKDAQNAQAKEFTLTMGDWAGLLSITLETTYNAVQGQSLTRTSINLGIDFSEDGETQHLDVSTLGTDFDPVREALNQLRLRVNTQV